MSNWKVYLLRCSDNSLYTGITLDLNRRLNEHNHDDRLASAYTRARRPVTIVYQESHTDRSSASKREAVIKKMPKAEKEKMIKKKQDQK
ncbi:MAG: GIY-YIG nuclease family protein [Proteobacteria bacterium]|nr:GIY-YIG nuclease family protein [Pseudomonadota bacterium]NOG61689.1 GIY-YIG nuclease family protein [Pseudomonadota bacterium]